MKRAFLGLCQVDVRMKKAAIKREQSDACISYAERKQARTKFNEE
jgi:hypothetical protein